jgi:hypothetical protein
MDCDALYRLLDAGNQPLHAGDDEAKRIFHASQTMVENLSVFIGQRK